MQLEVVDPQAHAQRRARELGDEFGEA